MINYPLCARFAFKGLFYFLVLSVVWDWCLAMSFAAAPRFPIPSAGKIYPYNMHGTIVYVTRSVHLVTNFGIWMALISLTAVVGSCVQKMQEIERRRKLHS
jgi:hypothetical protein